MEFRSYNTEFRKEVQENYIFSILHACLCIVHNHIYNVCCVLREKINMCHIYDMYLDTTPKRHSFALPFTWHYPEPSFGRYKLHPLMEFHAPLVTNTT